MSTTVAKLKGVDICCQTPEGAAFVKKYTHPPSVMPDEYRGVPDASAPNVVCIETKGENQVAPIISFPASTTTTIQVNPSTMLFLHPSGSKVATYNFMQVTVAGNTGYTQPLNYTALASTYPAVSNITAPSCNNSGYNWANFTTDIAMVRNTYKSETLYLNATDFNNQGQITTAKFKPNIIAVNNAAALFESHANDRASLRSLYTALGMKVPLPKISDEDGYEVIRSNVKSSTFGFGIQCLQVSPVSSITAITSMYNSPNFLLSGVLPTNSSQVINLSPKGSTRMLREGAFVVHQNINPTANWSEVSPEGAFEGTLPAPPNGVYVSLIRTNIGNTFLYAPLFSDGSVAGGALAYWYAQAFDTPWNNLDWAITICEGITVPTTVGTTLSSVPYVSIKSFSGFEAQPQFTSSLQPFQNMLPKPDPAALQMAAGIFHDRPDALPAAANDFGSIATAIGAFIPTAISWLKDLFGNGSKAFNESKPQPAPKNEVARKVKKESNRDNHRVDQLESMVRRLAMNQNRNQSNIPIDQYLQAKGYSATNRMAPPKAKPKLNRRRPTVQRKRNNKM